MTDRDVFLKQILDGYRSNYDVTPCEAAEGLIARAELHMKQGQHLIFKEFEMWSADDDEYVYIYYYPHLDAAAAERSINSAYEDGYPRIRLDHVDFKHQHMCTRLVALFIYGDADEDALKVIKKCRIYKSFQFSLKGWMEMHTAGISLDTGSIVSNRYGRETAKFLKMHAEHYAKHNADA